MEQIAIVTGASSGIGHAICEQLLARRFTVYGLARSFAGPPSLGDRFHPTVCDLADPHQLTATANAVLKDAGHLDILVNNAGIGVFGPHETLDPDRLVRMVNTNLTAPLLLTKLTLRALRESKGRIVNISSTAAIHPHRHGAAYAATKAGLLQFGESLFDEARKSGIRVTTLLPDMVPTGFYDDTDFEPSPDPLCHITSECVVNAMELVLDARAGTVPTQITLKPERVGINRKAR